jgi:N-acetylmuramoyl-L-alanine amidase
VFALAPVQSGQSNFQHRLVLDLYPNQEADPLEALIAERLMGDKPAPSEDKDALGEMAADHQKPATGTSEIAVPGRSAPTTDKTDRFVVVALDPGHGGEDPGAVGPNGTREKDVVLQIAHLLKERINKTVMKTKRGELPLRAFLTRDARFLFAIACTSSKSAKGASRFVHQLCMPMRFTPQASRCQCVCPQPRCGFQRSSALDGQQRKWCRCDWWVEHQGARPACATRFAGHEYHRSNQ